MTSYVLKSLTAVLLSLSLLGVAGAQQQFPMTRVQAKSCAEVDWNREMTQSHPRLVEACQEVVTVDGSHWARFEAKFLRMEPDGRVSFTIRDQRDRPVEEVVLQLQPGQVAYIDDRATPFAQLRQDQLVNLYVPEGQYGFATRPGVPVEQVAIVAPRATPPATTRVAAAPPQQQRSATLPATAGSLPWFALGGMISLLGAFGLMLRRKL
jgi:hypothetical protein